MVVEIVTDFFDGSISQPRRVIVVVEPATSGKSAASRIDPASTTITVAQGDPFARAAGNYVGHYRWEQPASSSTRKLEFKNSIRKSKSAYRGRRTRVFNSSLNYSDSDPAKPFRSPRDHSKKLSVRLFASASALAT